MNTTELTAILQYDRYTKEKFIGVFPADHLMSWKLKKLPACLICNSDPSWRAGTHWLAIFIDHNGNVEFFDSYGQDPRNYPMIYNFLNAHSDHFKTNTVQVQSELSSTCGQFCLYFLLWRSREIGFEKIIGSFSNNRSTNDFLVTTFVNSISGVNTKVYDVDFVVNQCCMAKSCTL